VPQYPALGSATFNQEAYAYGTAMPGVTQRIHEIALAARANAVESGAQAQSAAQAHAAAVSDTTAIKNAAVSDTTAIKNAAVSQTTAIADTARDYRDAAATSALSAAGAANYQGEYDPDKTYTVGQSVSDGALRFVAKRTVTGVTPVDGADWLLLRTSGPTLQGDPAPYVTQANTYTITNFNSFSSYAVSVTTGDVTLAGDTITYTAPSTAGSVDLTLTVDGQPTIFAITVQAAGVLRPTNISPAAGATGIFETPVLQSSAFATAGVTDTQTAARWRVYQGAALVHDSGWSTSSLTSYTVPAGVLVVSTAYTWTVEHRGTTLGDSAPSVATDFTTAATFNSYIPTPAPTPASFGAAFEGGFYYGMSWEALSPYKSTTFVTCSQSKTLSTGTHEFTINVDMASTPVVYAGQNLEVRSRANPNNKFIGTVTNATGNVITLNVTSISGSGTFSDWSFMSRYRLIVAPKASGENAGIALKNANSALPTACQTLTEGWAATMAMFTADTSAVYPAAHWARNLVINGFDDFFIPARDQLEPCWRNLKPVTNNNYVTTDRPTGASFNYTNNGSYGDTANTHGTNNNSSPTGAAYTASVPAQTAATAFRTGGAEAYEFGSAYYWSSSDYSATYAWGQNWDSSYPGHQNNNGKAYAYRVRAVRRSVI
jgi:hypothetical protein